MGRPKVVPKENSRIETIRLTIPFKPMPQARARFGTRAYKDPDVAAYEEMVKSFFVEKFPAFVPLEGSICMTIVFNQPIPATASRKEREKMLMADLLPICKPDTSNMLKLFEDALNGLAYVDDSQIVAIIPLKKFSESPSTEMLITSDLRAFKIFYEVISKLPDALCKKPSRKEIV